MNIGDKELAVGSQFHYGSIQMVWRSQAVQSSEQSQFHYGSIQIITSELYYSFENSSQFHYGSIQINAPIKTGTGDWCLNSTMVRFK